MEKETYRQRLKSSEFEEVITPIFDFFEPFINQEPKFKESVNENYNDEEILNYYNMLIEQNIEVRISALRKKVSTEKYVAMRSFVLSLQQNTTQFLSNEKYRSRVKWKKILNSYINVSRFVLEYEKIQLLWDGFPDVSQQLVVAMSLIDLKEDDIKANDEIEKICDLFKDNPNVIVVPIHGCSTDVFRTILDRFPTLSMIHLAGHTCQNSRGQVLLSFVDSNMTFMRFCNFISNYSFHCSFLNCCSTSEFVSDSYLLNSEHYILHRGEVSSTVAYDFAQNFYTVISSGGDLDYAWDLAVSNCNENPMNYLRSTI